MIIYFIVGIFLSITLVLAFKASKDVKTIKDYISANQDLGLGILYISLLATCIGSSDLEEVWAVHKHGLIAAIVGFGVGVPFALTGLFIAPKLVHFRDCLTISDLMSTFCKNENVGIFTGIISSCFSCLIVGANLLVLGEIGMVLLNMTKTEVVCLFGVVFVTYSSLGGLRAVAYTDVLQFAALVVVMGIITSVGIYEVGGFKSLLDSQPLDKCIVYNHPRFIPTLRKILFFRAFPTLVFTHPNVLRMLAIKNPRKAGSMLYTTAAYYTMFRLVVIVLGMCCIVLYPNEKAGSMIAFMIKNLFESNIVRGILLCGLIAILMSTADSHLHSCGIAVIYDVFRVLLRRRGISINKELKWIRLATLLVGLFSIFLTVMGIKFLHGQMIFRFYFFGMSLYSTLIIPFILGIMGVKIHAKSFFVAFFITIPTTILLYMIPYPLDKYSGWFFVILTHTITFLIMNYIQNSGFVTVKRNKYVTT